jgi:ABC-type polysaccharide/polyol phosphate transport system ATPase subunit
MNPPIAIRRRERDAVLQSLQAGLVPKQGLHLIQVGRKAEVSALLKDIERVCDEGACFRIVVGRFGSGKSFFLNLVRNPRVPKKARRRSGRLQHGTAALRQRRTSASALQRADAQHGNQGQA